jgi:hypothetical protein
MTRTVCTRAVSAFAVETLGHDEGAWPLRRILGTRAKVAPVAVSKHLGVKLVATRGIDDAETAITWFGKTSVESAAENHVRP